MIRAYYFVYRGRDPAAMDPRCPIGGVSVTGWCALARIRDAWLKARSRFVCKPSEVLMLVEVAGHDKQRQVRMMEADWERAFADFQELMTVS